MAREPITVEVVQPPLGTQPTRRVANGPDVWEVQLYPGSRSELMQRLGEAYLKWQNAWDAGVDIPDYAEIVGPALAALRQHDTEHGRTDA